MEGTKEKSSNQIKLVQQIIDKKNLRRKIKLPPISTIFKFKRNPLHDKEEVGEMCRLMQEFSGMSADHYMSKIIDICEFTAYFHPFVENMQKYLNLCRAMQLFFIIDDQVECHWGQVARSKEQAKIIWGQVDQCFVRLTEGPTSQSMAEWKPYIVALYNCLEDMFKVYNPVQKKRLADSYRNWGNGNREEDEQIRAGRKFETIEKYLQVRKLSIGAHCVCAMIEYADDLHLSEEEWELMADYLDECAYPVVLANDFQSIEKEMKDQKDNPGMITNAVDVIMRLDSCSIDEALIKVSALNHEYEKKAKLTKDKLMAIPNISNDMKTFLDRVEYVISGNFIVGLSNRRYTQ